MTSKVKYYYVYNRDTGRCEGIFAEAELVKLGFKSDNFIIKYCPKPKIEGMGAFNDR